MNQTHEKIAGIIKETAFTSKRKRLWLINSLADSLCKTEEERKQFLKKAGCVE